MVKIFLNINGMQKGSSFSVNETQSLISHFPDYNQYKFVLYEDNLFSTITQVKEFIKDGQDNLVFIAISDEEVATKYNEQNKTLKSQKQQEALATQFNKQQQKIDISTSEKQLLLQENGQQNQSLDENLYKKCSNSTSLSRHKIGSLIKSSKYTSGRSDFLTSQKIQLQNQHREDEEVFLSNYLFKGGELQQFYQEEEKQCCSSQLNLNTLVYSKLLTVEFKCFYCQLGLTGNFIFTNCQHTYHEECLLKIIETQSEENSFISQLTCLCSKQISLQLLQLFQDKQWVDMLKIKIFNNQLKEIQCKQQQQYVKCPRDYCEFFCINTNDPKANNLYCPVCSEIIQNQ